MKTIKNKTFLAVVATILVAGTALFVSCSKEDSDENIPHQKSDVENLLFSSEYIKGNEKTTMHCIGIDSTTEQFKYSFLSTTIKDGALVDDSKGIWIIDRDNLPFEVGDIVMNESDTGFYIYCQEEEIFIHDVEISENSLSFTAKNKNDEYIEFITGKNGILEKWLELGASGYRLDVADELPDKFIDALYKSIKSLNKDYFVIGEVWEDATNKFSHGGRRRYLLGGQLDSVMNYPFANAILDFMRYGILQNLFTCGKHQRANNTAHLIAYARKAAQARST